MQSESRILLLNSSIDPEHSEAHASGGLESRIDNIVKMTSTNAVVAKKRITTSDWVKTVNENQSQPKTKTTELTAISLIVVFVVDSICF